MRTYELIIEELDGNVRIFDTTDKFWVEIVKVLHNHNIQTRDMITKLSIEYMGDSDDTEELYLL
jgi:glucuronate isomerase